MVETLLKGFSNLGLCICAFPYIYDALRVIFTWKAGDDVACVAIDDDVLNDWWGELSLIKTYFHSYNRPNFALARWGVTLIPPESLKAFYNIVSTDRRSKTSKELIDLIILLRKAMSENKYIIHYGV